MFGMRKASQSSFETARTTPSMQHHLRKLRKAGFDTQTNVAQFLQNKDAHRIS